MPISESSNTSWRTAAVPVAVVIGLAVIGLLYMRSGSTPEVAEVAPTPAAETGKHSSRVENRLEAIRKAHERALEGGAGEPSAGGEKTTVKSGNGVANTLRPKPQAQNAMQGAFPGAENQVDDDQDPDDIPGLRKMALEDSDPERRLAAVTLLGASDDPQAIPILAQALQDGDEEVRLAAIQSLADVTGDVPVDVIGQAAVNDPSADNRYEALEVLSDVGDAASRSYIEKALNDPDEDVRSLAEGILDLEDTYEDGGKPAPAGTPHG
ncbi:MAG: HEAT repeat domain-containing protein [Deltaproteobacteria bacterium]|nr:HEAT repeat domain-containing protein [Deltaproteobacteria bacterium]